MKLEELRIGNWIHNPVQKVDFKVDIQTLQEIKLDEMSKRPTFEPIPISEEWLLKFGFFKDENFLPYGLMCFYEVRAVFDNEKLNVYYDDFLIIIKYIHQLQNLHHSLTGKELEIKNYETKQNNT